MHLDAGVVCAGCGCLCDDIQPDGTNLCELGRRYWQQLPAVEVASFVKEQPVSVDQSIEVAVTLLREAKAPGILGLNLISCEACEAAVKLAQQLNAWVSPWPADPLRFWGHSSPDLALSRAEMQSGADLVIYLGFADGVDAVQPRHRERHLARGLGIVRPQLHLPWNGKEGLARTLELRFHLEREEPASPEVMQIARAIQNAKCIQVYALAQLAQHSPSLITHWQLLAAKQRSQRRMGVALLGSTGKARTVTETMTWLTGFPGPVKFTNGVPEYLPHIGEVDELLKRQACDIVLWVGYQPDARARGGLAMMSVFRMADFSVANSVDSSREPPSLARRAAIVGRVGMEVRWQLPGLHPLLDAHVIRGDTVMLRLAGSGPGIPDPMANLLHRLREELTR